MCTSPKTPIFWAPSIMKGSQIVSSLSGRPRGLCGFWCSLGIVAAFNCAFPLAPRTTRMALRADSTVGICSGLSANNRRASVNDGLSGYLRTRSSASFLRLFILGYILRFMPKKRASSTIRLTHPSTYFFEER